MTAQPEPNTRPNAFGEFLVEHRVVSRHQLLQALQLQDLRPALRLGQCMTELGFAPTSRIEQLFLVYVQRRTTT
jgi:hypothetical protein